MYTGRLYVKSNGDVSEPGVDRGPNPGRLLAEKRHETAGLHILVVKWPGCSFWNGIGRSRGYAPSQTAVYTGVLRPNPPPEGVRQFVEVKEFIRWGKEQHS